MCALQMTSNFAIENCLEGQPLLVDGQDPQTSLLLMNSSSNSIRDLFTLQNTVTPGCLYRGYTPSTAVLVRQLPPRRKESQKKIVPRVRFPGFRRKQRVTAGGALLEQNGVRIGPQKFLAAVGAMHRAEHPNLARVRAYNRAKNRSCFIVWEGFGRTIPITVRDALDGGAVKAFSGEQDAGALFLDWTAR